MNLFSQNKRHSTHNLFSLFLWVPSNMYSRNQAQLKVGKCPTLPLKKVIVEPPLLHTFLHKVHRPIRNEKFGLAMKSLWGRLAPIRYQQ